MTERKKMNSPTVELESLISETTTPSKDFEGKVKSLIDQGADIFASYGKNEESLIDFVSTVPVVSYLLLKGRERILEHRNRYDRNPLFNVRDGEKAKALLNGGFDCEFFAPRREVFKKELLNQRDSFGKTPLQNALLRGFNDIVPIFLSVEGVDLFNIDNQGNNFLHGIRKFPRLVSYLVRKGLDVNAQNHDGKTPLQRAVFFGDIALVKELLNNGADPKIKSNDGKSSYDLVSDILEEQISSTGRFEITPAHRILKLLHEKMTEINAFERESKEGRILTRQEIQKGQNQNNG